MTVLPIVERELRVAARRRGTYLTRAGSALVAILICAWLFLTASREPVRQLGQILFVVLSFIFFTVSLLLGVVYTADCLSEEKREGTLGLLFLTDLKGYDVVLGKLAASSVNAFYGMLAIFPVLAIPLLLGGVAVGEFWRLVLVLANTLFFSLAAGIFVSSVTRNARHATVVTLLLILGLNALAPAVGLYIMYRTRAPDVPEVFLVPSAGYAFALVHEFLFRSRALQFYYSVATTHGLAWVLLVFASIAARYSWQERTPGAAMLAFQRRWRQWIYGGAEQSSAFRTRLLEINPCFWLSGRHRVKPLLVWGFLGLGAALWLVGYAKWRRDWLQEPVYIVIALAVHTILRCWVASEACQCFGPDRRSGALELVLSTPLSVRDILYGQVLALRRQFLGPVACVAAVDLLFMVTSLSDASVEDRKWWTWMWLAGVAVFLFDAYTLIWVGMWLGLTARHITRAALNSVALVLVLPWLVLGGLLTGIGVFSIRMPEPAGWYILGLYFGVAVGVDALSVAWAKFHLYQDLRTVATHRFELRRPLLRRWARGQRVAAPGLPPTPAP